MAPAKAHPVPGQLRQAGLIEQEPGTGHYGLGPLALQLGLISLQQYDPVRLATPLIEELAQLTGHTMAIAVWGNRGADDRAGGRACRAPSMWRCATVR